MNPKTIALVGATGHLGTLIARALLDQPDVVLRLLVRPGSRAKAAPLEARGAQIVEGTLDADDEATLSTLCEGAFAVVSAVQGGPDVIIDGQRRLLLAARAAHVRRFVPSDYSLDLFAVKPGNIVTSEMRRQFALLADAERGDVEVVHVLNGGFLDRGVLFGFIPLVDLQTQTAYLWGDGDQPMDWTTYEDTARYTAAAAVDERPVPSKLCVAGDVLDFAALVREYEAGSGKTLRVERLGSLDDLGARIAERQKADPRNLLAYLPLMYLRSILSGEGKLPELMNDRYPEIPAHDGARVRGERGVVMKTRSDVTWRHTPVSELDLQDLRVAVVGGTGGLGRALALALASRGAHVLVVGRTFRDAGTPNVEYVAADLSLMKEAKRVGEELPAEDLDMVVFTTGIFAAPKRQETPEGIERDMAVSYLSRLVILREIADRLGSNRDHCTIGPRVFVMGYPGTGQKGTLDDLNAEKSYSGMSVHMNTVAGNEMLVLDAAKRYPRLAVFGLNPGLIKTNIRDNFFGKDTLKSRVIEWLIGLFTPTPDGYAEAITPLLVAPELGRHSGAMFDRKGHAIEPTDGLTTDRIDAFLSQSDDLVARATVG